MSFRSFQRLFIINELNTEFSACLGGDAVLDVAPAVDVETLVADTTIGFDASWSLSGFLMAEGLKSLEVSAMVCFSARPKVNVPS